MEGTKGTKRARTDQECTSAKLTEVYTVDYSYFVECFEDGESSHREESLGVFRSREGAQQKVKKFVASRSVRWRRDGAGKAEDEQSNFRSDGSYERVDGGDGSMTQTTYNVTITTHVLED